jgi:hypothetical protein
MKLKEDETVSSASEFSSLPPYIKRHLSTRYALWEEEDSWHSPGEQTEYIRYALEDRQQNGLKYLGLTIRDIRYAGHSNAELIQMLADLPTDGSGQAVVSELIRRLARFDKVAKSQLAEILIRISGHTQQQTLKRTVADRAAMRLLFRMNFEQAFPAASVCASSPRAIRREASYRFYLANGVDEAGREILAETVWEASIRYRRVITTDQLLVLKLGLARVLDIAPSTYWRMIAIGKTLESTNPAEILNICMNYPLELIWAISENHSIDLMPHILRMLEQYRDDAYILNRILQCLVRLENEDGITMAIEYGTQLLLRDGAQL